MASDIGVSSESDRLKRAFEEGWAACEHMAGAMAVEECWHASHTRGTALDDTKVIHGAAYTRTDLVLAALNRRDAALVALVAQWRDEGNERVETGRGYLSAMEGASRETLARCADELAAVIERDNVLTQQPVDVRGSNVGG